MMNKILKTLELFNATKYSVPRPDEMNYKLNILQNDIYEQRKFLYEAENMIMKFIKERSGDVKSNLILGRRTFQV